MNSRKKVAVGMSGGVDSSVAAALLVQQGYAVTGVYLEAYNTPGCRTDQDKADALKVAIVLGVPFKTLDLRNKYREKVTDYFVESYRQGETPNPDVVCNKEIKFGEFYRWAREEGYDYVATGHYCRILQGTEPCNIQEIDLQGTEPCNWLQRGRDVEKDQSYFLWQVQQEYLKRIIFPLGEMKKNEVRELARSLGLPNAEKPDSMGVCMMGRLNVREFLRDKLGERKGEVVMRRRKGSELFESSEPLVVGKHQGLWFQTVGQRIGQGITLQGRTLKAVGIEATKKPAMYVVGKIVEKNQLLIGRKEECYTNNLQISSCKFELGMEEIRRFAKDNNLLVRIRNLGELYKISELKEPAYAQACLPAGRASAGKQKSELIIETEQPVFAPTKGQSAVLYARMGEEGEEVVVGGGIIV